MLGRAAVAGTLAAVASTLVLAWRGGREAGSAVLPLNAPVHWLQGDAALHDRSPSVRRTGASQLIHWASSVFWALGFEAWRGRREARTPANLLAGAAAVSAVAAAVDLKLVPHRLTPGFQEHLSRRGLAWVYAGFAAGLAVGGVLLNRRRPTMPA
jgi:hypothetical protein